MVKEIFHEFLYFSLIVCRNPLYAVWLSFETRGGSVCSYSTCTAMLILVMLNIRQWKRV